MLHLLDLALETLIFGFYALHLFLALFGSPFLQFLNIFVSLELIGNSLFFEFSLHKLNVFFCPLQLLLQQGILHLLPVQDGELLQL